MSIKSKIKKSFLGKYLISELHCIECWLIPKLISDKKAVSKFYKKNTGKDLNLKNPVTFSEKLNWYKLNSRLPLMQQCADKVAVRNYLIQQGFGDLLNEVYGEYDSVKNIDIDVLPKRFVLKAAHGSHMNIIVTDKTKENWVQHKMMMMSWLRQNIYWSGREWVYKDIPRRIIAEKYLEDSSGELRDYKFFCFNGTPIFMQLETGRFKGKNTRNFYDMEWNLMPFGKGRAHDPDFVVSKPERFEEMKSIAEALCKPFQFVRVDLYQTNDKIYFGEFTFFPAGGTPNFRPSKYDEIVGDMWDLRK